MKVFMIGGTGLLGSEAAAELIRRGHEVSTMALPPVPDGAILPPEMKIELGDYTKLTDEELTKRLKGFDALIFAAGIDERVESAPPVYDLFKKHNIDAPERLLRLSKKAGLKKAVIMGSYFSYFAKSRPEDELTKWHPYIRSRVDQENMCMSFAGPDFDVAVLELPYIFGAQPGRKPVWVFLVETVRSMKKATMYPKGGTTMVTVKQVGQAVAGALEFNSGGNCYPIGYYNFTWKEFLSIVHKHMGEENKKIITIPTFLFRLGMIKTMKNQKKNNIEGGLNMKKFYKLQCSHQFIDKNLGCVPLGVEPDDIDAAIGESVKLSIDILDGNVDIVDMKAN